MILEGFDCDAFLRNHWQRQPFLIKHSGKPFKDPIEADELAGLACEDAVESRIVITSSDDEYQVQHGPFSAADFTALGEKDWTLLVQAVDQIDADVASLKNHFDFLPSWRIDDVMVSYASAGGGVGPHFDQYDVFLIQGTGRRRWRIGERCDSNSPLRENTELRLLREFITVREVVLEPGDILYLPPRFAHHGISMTESLCYSVGFRAPSFAELLQGFSDELAGVLTEDQRFEDPLPMNITSQGCISPQSIQAALEKLAQISSQTSRFISFFGKAVTEPRYPDKLDADAEAADLEQMRSLVSKAASALEITQNPHSRFAYFTDQDRLTLFVDGEQFDCQQDQLTLVQQLCSTPWPDSLELDDALQTERNQLLISRLVAQGSLLVEPIETQ